MTAHCDVSRPFDGYRPPSSLLPASRLRSDENFIARPYLSLSLSLSLSFFRLDLFFSSDTLILELARLHLVSIK